MGIRAEWQPAQIVTRADGSQYVEAGHVVYRCALCDRDTPEQQTVKRKFGPAENMHTVCVECMVRLLVG